MEAATMNPAADPNTIEGAAEDPDAGLQEPYIEGATGQLTLDVGGRGPDQASVRLRGGSIAVEGEFQKGDEITLIVTARISEVHFVDKMDPAGFVKSTERRHFARMEGVRRG